MNLLQTLGFIGLSANQLPEDATSLDALSEPILHWRLDIVPDLENSTSVQYSGVNAYNELLYRELQSIGCITD